MQPARALVHGLFLFGAACGRVPAPAFTPSSEAPALYIYRFDPPALIELTPTYRMVRAIPFAPPADCGLYDVFAAPSGRYLALEFSCPSGPTVLFLDPETGAARAAYPDSDSHFLAWAADGSAIYIKADALARPRLLRVEAGTQRQQPLPLSELTYAVAPSPDGQRLLFALTPGIGFGSQLWLADQDGRAARPLLRDAENILAFPRFSPDGRHIALIKFPDSQTPYPPGELWVMNADGSSPRKLAPADAGHGFAPAWSPDGRQIAYVGRENAGDARVQQEDAALISNLYLVDLLSGRARALTPFADARVQAPVWAPAGNVVAFTAIVDGKIGVYAADVASGEIRPIDTQPACCPAWIRR